MSSWHRVASFTHAWRRSARTCGARHRARASTPSALRRAGRRSRSRSRWTARASATGSASCPWRAGTARPTASRRELTHAALAELRPQRGQADLGRRGGRGAQRRPRQPEPAPPHRRRRCPRSRACARRSWPRTASGSAPDADRDLLVGLQLTHSGRYSRPHAGPPEPLVAYAHPVLDRRFPGGVRVAHRRRPRPAGRRTSCAPARLARDAGLRVRGRQALPRLSRPRAARRAAARRAATAARFENRTRFLRDVVDGHPRRGARACGVGVRLSVFDTVPVSQATGPGRACRRRPRAATTCGFGLLADDDLDPALDDARARPAACSSERGVRWVCVTAGSPYYNPHVQRPALFPPSDGYDPAGGPAARRGPADRGHRPAQGRVPASWCSWAPPTAICRSGCPTSPSTTCAKGRPTSSASAAWCCPTPSCPPTCSPGGRCGARRSAARSATARRARAWASSPAAIPLDPFYAAHPDAARLPALTGLAPGMTARRGRACGATRGWRWSPRSSRSSPSWASRSTGCRSSTTSSCRTSAGRGSR